MSEGNRVRIAWRLQGSTDWNILRRTNDGLNAGTETERSNEIRSDRKRSGQKVVTQNTGGTVDFEFTPNDYDAFLEAAMCTTFQADTPTVGTSQLSVGTLTTKFEILKSFLDENKHVLMKEMEIGQLQVDMQAGSKVTGQITFAGTETNSAYDPSTDNFLDAGTALFYDASNNLSSLQIDGAPLAGVLITGQTVTINNNHQTGQGVGTQFQYHDKGSADITTTKMFRMSAGAFDLWAKTLTNTPISSSFVLGDGTTDYAFKIGKEFLSGDLPNGAIDSILTLQLNGVVATDAANEMLLIEKTAAA